MVVIICMCVVFVCEWMGEEVGLKRYFRGNYTIKCVGGLGSIQHEREAMRGGQGILAGMAVRRCVVWFSIMKARRIGCDRKATPSKHSQISLISVISV